jgi:hypothetical protein
VPLSVVAVPVDVEVAVVVAVDADPEAPEVPLVDPEAPDVPEVPAVDPELPEEVPDEPEVDGVVDVPVEVAVPVGVWLPDPEPLLSFEVEPHAAETAVTSTRPEIGERRMLLKDPRTRGGIHARSPKHTSNGLDPKSRFGLVWRERSLSVSTLLCSARLRRLNKIAYSRGGSLQWARGPIARLIPQRAIFSMAAEPPAALA